MKHVTQLKVLMGNEHVGTLAQSPDRRIYFSYAPNWLQDGFDLCPHTLRFTADLQLPKSDMFSGLHGVFSDSLPDAWGTMLTNRVLKQRFGWNRQDITPLDRLACIGNRAMGALNYTPAFPSAGQEEQIDLDEMAGLIEAVFCDEEAIVLDKLLMHGGSPGGARPKVLVARNPASGTCLSGHEALPPGFSHWLVKFKAPGDHDPADIGNIEKAYAEMAKASGVEMPETDLVRIGNGQSCFAVKRFDRTPEGGRIHMLSLSGWAYADHRIPCLDYDEILKAVRILTQDENEVKKAFRLAVFNVMAVNKDDHAKNFAFLYKQNRWSFAPAFDLTFNNILSEHTTSTMGRGNPGRVELVELAEKHGLSRLQASEMIDLAQHTTSLWQKTASDWGVSSKSAEQIEVVLQQTSKRF